jgi:predicted nucleic acid-binding Zn finger protein
LAESKLAEAEALVNEGMQACREMVGLQDSEEKEKLKKVIRYLVNYKLALKVSVYTA